MFFVQYMNTVRNPKQSMLKVRIIQSHNKASKLSVSSIQCASISKVTLFHLFTKQKHIETLHKSASAEMKTLVEVYCKNLGTDSVLQNTTEIQEIGARLTEYKLPQTQTDLQGIGRYFGSLFTNKYESVNEFESEII